MTVKCLDIQTISIRSQNDTERAILDNLKGLLLTKPANVYFKEDDLIVEVKATSKKGEKNEN